MKPPVLTYPALGLAVIAVGLVLRVGFAFANAYWLDIPHMDGFHRVATLFAAGEETLRFRIGWIYAYVLGLVYAVTGPHEIVGFVASALAWLGAAFVLDAMLRLLGAAPRARLAALAVFAFMPSSIFFGSMIMRDVYQLLFVNLMLLSALRVGIERDYGAAVPMVLSGIAAGLLHVAFMPWAVIVVFATLAWALILHRPRQKMLVVLSFVGVVFAVFTAAMFLRYGYRLSQGLAEASLGYRGSVARAMTPRTEFRTLADSDLGGLPGLAVGFFQYMLEPLPWHVQNLGDLGVMGENLFRLVLIGMAIWALFTDRARRAPLLLLLLAYCCLEGIWSLGTAAWGTAIRHHLPASGLLVAAAFSSYRFERVGAPARAG